MKKDRSFKIATFWLGFSLLELMVVVVLIGILIAIAVPSISALSGLDLKREITKIAGLTNEIYDLAAISGKTHRVVFDLDNGSFWVEEKVGEVGEIKPELGYEDLMKERILKKREEDSENENEFIPQYKMVSGSWGEKVLLPKGMVIYGAWTEQMTEIARSGQISIYFFSGGYTQDSFVSLAAKGEEEQSSIYLALNALTGSVTIKLGEPDIEDLLMAKDENNKP